MTTHLFKVCLDFIKTHFNFGNMLTLLAQVST